MPRRSRKLGPKAPVSGSVRGLAILLVACSPTTTVVEIPARPLPPMAPAEVASADPADPDAEPEPTSKIKPVFDFGGVDISGAPAPPPRVRRCPPPTVTVGTSCLTAVSKSGPANGCTLLLNSIPPTHAFVDGGYIGTTPQTDVVRAAGTHTVMFFAFDETEKKSLTVTCATGERKTVVAKLR
jgi:hypothetical protein